MTISFRSFTQGGLHFFAVFDHIFKSLACDRGGNSHYRHDDVKLKFSHCIFLTPYFLLQVLWTGTCLCSSEWFYQSFELYQGIWSNSSKWRLCEYSAVLNYIRDWQDHEKKLKKHFFYIKCLAIALICQAFSKCVSHIV